jgi:hypothetical protein
MLPCHEVTRTRIACRLDEKLPVGANRLKAVMLYYEWLPGQQAKD